MAVTDRLFNVATAGKVSVQPSEVADFIRSSDGPVMRKMIELGEVVKVATIHSLKPGFPRDFLGPRIVKRITVGQDGPHVLVGSDQLKTAPHVIEGNPLAFEWSKVGGTVFFRSVHHPGSDFTKYLTERLTEAVFAVKGHL